MKGILNLFKKQAAFRASLGQLLELEWQEANQAEQVVYATVQEVAKKKLVLACSSPLSNKLAPGIKVRVCALSGGSFQSYQANLLDKNGNTLEVSLSGSETVDQQVVPNFDNDKKIDFVTSVDYQASRSPYKQAAEVIAVGRNGVTLKTNMSLPRQTQLEVFVKLPNRAQPLNGQVRTVSSESLADPKKFATEVEFVEFSEADREALWDVALRHHLRVTTRTGGG